MSELWRATRLAAGSLVPLAVLVAPRVAVGEVDIPHGEEAPPTTLPPAPGVATETPETTASAEAAAAASTSHFEVAALAGYLSPPIRGGTTPFGAGLSGRFGLVLSNVYIGGKLAGYLGGTDVDISDRSLLYGLELGYGFRLDAFGGTHFVVRPQVGAGAMTIFHTDPSLAGASTTTATGGRARASVDVITAASSSSGGGGSGSSSLSDTTTVTNVYVEPGLSVMWTSGVFFVGALGSMVVVPGISYSGADASTWVSYGLAGQIGVSF